MINGKRAIIVMSILIFLALMPIILGHKRINVDFNKSNMKSTKDTVTAFFRNGEALDSVYIIGEDITIYYPNKNGNSKRH